LSHAEKRWLPRFNATATAFLYQIRVCRGGGTVAFLKKSSAKNFKKVFTKESTLFGENNKSLTGLLFKEGSSTTEEH